MLKKEKKSQIHTHTHKHDNKNVMTKYDINLILYNG